MLILKQKIIMLRQYYVGCRIFIQVRLLLENFINGTLISFNITLLSAVYRNDWLKLTFNCFFANQSRTISSNQPIILFDLLLLQFFDRAKETNV